MVLFKNKKTNANTNDFQKLFASRKGFSTGYTWIFGLVTLFGLGILYISFSQVLKAHLVPTIIDQVNGTYSNIDPATQTEIIRGITKYMTFFDILPFIIFFVVVIYMIVAAWRKEREEF